MMGAKPRLQAMTALDICDQAVLSGNIGAFVPITVRRPN